MAGAFLEKGPKGNLCSVQPSKDAMLDLDRCKVMYFSRRNVRTYAVRAKKSPKLYLVHRLSFVIRKGGIPVGKIVMHRCNVKLCVRHLRLGVHQQNASDGAKCGLFPRGVGRINSKLSDRKVARLRLDFKNGVTVPVIAKKLNVSQKTVWQAATGKSWKHVQ